MKIFTKILSLITISTFLLGNVQAQLQLGALTGYIKTNDGKPASYVNIAMNNTQHATQTDEKGFFTLKNLTAGNYTLKISAVGLSTQEQAVTIIAGQSTTFSASVIESAAQLKEVMISGYKSPNHKQVNLSKVSIESRDLPQAVQIINAQVITDQQANTLGDVMKNINGVALGANRGGVGENFYSRGYSLGTNNIFKNGSRTSIGGNPEASTLESVEVLKGSAALLYGGVTGGAVVNMVTKKPKFEYGGELLMRAGSYNQYKPTIDLYGPISKKVALRAISTYEKADSFRDYVKSNRFYINPSLLYKISDKTEVLVQGDYLKSNYTPDFGVGSVNSKIIDYGRNNFINTPWAYNKTNTSTAQANVSHKFSENWKLNILGSLQAYNRDYYGSDRINANAAGISARNLSRVLSEEHTYNQQINLNGNFNTGRIKHTLLIGIDADQSRITSRAFAFGKTSAGANITTFNYGNVNLFDPTTYYGSGIMPEAFVVTRTLAPIYRYGAFIQDLVEITDQFKVLAGIRYTDQKNARSRALNLQTGAITKTATKFDDAFSPKIGLIYQPLKTTSMYVSYANNFIANSGIDVNNNALTPSIVNQYETGIKNDFFGGKLTVNLTYYKIINSNISQAAIMPDGSVSAIFRQLNGETTSDGFEADITGNLTRGLNFLMGYSYNYMRYTNTADITGMIEDVRLVGTTKNTANATVFYTLQDGAMKGLKLGTSAFFTGKRNGGWNDAKNAATIRLIPLNAFTTLDFSAGYTFKKFSLLAKISNITNELNYFVHENYSVNPIAPRQFATTLSYKFN